MEGGVVYLAWQGSNTWWLCLGSKANYLCCVRLFYLHVLFVMDEFSFSVSVFGSNWRCIVCVWTSIWCVAWALGMAVAVGVGPSGRSTCDHSFPRFWWQLRQQLSKLKLNNIYWFWFLNFSHKKTAVYQHIKKRKKKIRASHR